MESKKIELREPESRVVITRDGGNGEMLFKVHKIPGTIWVSSRALMYNIMIIVNNTIQYTWKLLREQILNFLTTKKKKKEKLYEIREVLANATVIIILQYISISNQCAINIKLTVLYVNYVSLKLVGGERGNSRGSLWGSKWADFRMIGKSGWEEILQE